MVRVEELAKSEGVVCHYQPATTHDTKTFSKQQRIVGFLSIDKCCICRICRKIRKDILSRTPKYFYLFRYVGSGNPAFGKICMDTGYSDIDLLLLCLY